MGQDRQTSIIVGLAMALGLLIAAVVAYSLVLVVDAGRGAMAYKNPTSSMQPTILAGDYITARRLEGVGENPRLVHRGEIILHQFPPDPSKLFMKRVVGVPGDTISMNNGVVWVNGKPLSETYTLVTDSADPVVEDFQWQRRYLVGQASRDTAHYVASRNNWGPLLVPPDDFFVLGDHRDNSLDSRYFGFVTAHQVLGRVRRVYFSRDTSGGIRWSRIGYLPQ